jgi:hypothetical protein
MDAKVMQSSMIKFQHKQEAIEKRKAKNEKKSGYRICLESAADLKRKILPKVIWPKS